LDHTIIYFCESFILNRSRSAVWASGPAPHVPADYELGRWFAMEAGTPNVDVDINVDIDVDTDVDIDVVVDSINVDVQVDEVIDVQVDEVVDVQTEGPVGGQAGGEPAVSTDESS
jgi:hypothetical protein